MGSEAFAETKMGLGFESNYMLQKGRDGNGERTFTPLWVTGRHTLPHTPYKHGSLVKAHPRLWCDMQSTKQKMFHNCFFN